MCVHLDKVSKHLQSISIKETWRGQPWTDNCREWIYYDAVLDPVYLHQLLSLEAFVQVHDYFDIKAGSEKGLICAVCNDAVMGIHPDSPLAKDKPVVNGLS